VAPTPPERTRRQEEMAEEGAAKVSVLRADLFLWFLLLSAVVSGGFVVLALDNDDRTLAWCAAAVFALISLVAVGEMLLWRGS
jgi:hypothetical protein